MSTDRAQRVADFYDALAPERDRWIARSDYFYRQDRNYMRFLIPEGASVLEIGCGTGQLLAALKPARGTGIDISPAMIEAAKSAHPGLEFVHGDAADPKTYEGLGEAFDYVVISDAIGLFEDCQAVLNAVRGVCTRETRIVIAYVSHLWDPVLRLAELSRQKMPQLDQNWLPTTVISGLLHLAEFETVSREWRLLLPASLFGLGSLINRWIATLPLVRKLCLRNYVVARPLGLPAPGELPVTIVVPCRNEHGNIEAAVTRLPRFGKTQEIIFVEGGSTDQTFEECQRVRDAYPDRDIKTLRQEGKGKYDAVRTGFEAARGDILIILDADLTVPPEDLPKFYDAIVSGKGEFINGSRLVYPMEQDAMRFLNLCANWVFGKIFSYLLNQRYSDTLCGTKALRRVDYEKIRAANTFARSEDPFGDFDLIVGAARLGLRTVEIPVRYRSRVYGMTQISRFLNGLQLLRMSLIVFRRFKAI